MEVARAFAMNPRLLVLDALEKTLSSAERRGLFAALCTIAARGAGVLRLGGSLEDACAVGGRYSVLREGRTVGMGSLAHLDAPVLAGLMAGEGTRVFPRFAHCPGAPVLRIKTGASVDLTLRAGEMWLRRGSWHFVPGVGASRRELLASEREIL